MSPPRKAEVPRSRQCDPVSGVPGDFRRRERQQLVDFAVGQELPDGQSADVAERPREWMTWMS
ncbi:MULTISPECIES: hypothetical protein [unclassified Streptomyces]|uniref:hypothetical protein n=1 Tax=Streptomyces TaxID=1883 RepID=UPI001368210D|nr:MULTISPECIES: hypothetical protein [unclassified Streptomyces]NEA03745.1 hypothetical protein [Streptomyces sp. SID10116]MYY84378.1 hypothetical protein [Streptomyces sp. SID335]MYZ19024.1 hypothetical protein [Streptomyces sp. SID337]NDZ89434.1 hypothetical protein [Streptomyces sp. SID10115]NDZ90193.1 hypothetical protein [Streptomyces sp. SID10115]